MEAANFSLVTAIFALAVTVLLLPDGAFSQKKTTEPSDRKALARKPATSGALKDRLGDDDGYGCRLLLGRCPRKSRGSADAHPAPGGVARRMGYINAFRKRAPGAATVLVDAGYIFAHDRGASPNRLRDDALLMNDWIVRANEQMPLEVVNLRIAISHTHRNCWYPSRRRKNEIADDFGKHQACK